MFGIEFMILYVREYCGTNVQQENIQKNIITLKTRIANVQSVQFPPTKEICMSFHACLIYNLKISPFPNSKLSPFPLISSYSPYLILMYFPFSHHECKIHD